MILLLMQAVRIGSPSLGIIIPSLIFIIAFVVTWILYKHFSKNL